MTSRGPLSLAALASAAVPGLDPDSVEGVVPPGPGHAFDVAFVQDLEHRRWVIRCPRTPAASAQLEQSAALLALLARRLTMPVPAVKGWAALPEGGRAAVHGYLTGRLVELSSVAAGSQLAAGLGRALAQLHNLDRQVYEEAGVPVYEAEAYRARRLAELDRAAATGRVPTGLLGRWERLLEDVSLWRFTTVPTHGAIDGRTILATPDDGEEPDVKGFLGWESAQVADPADDLAALVGELDPEALDTVLEAYAHARVDRPDRHLQQRARLVHEMQLVRSMMAAVAAGEDDEAERCAARLRRLDERLADEEGAVPVVATAPEGDPVPEADVAADVAADEVGDEAQDTEDTEAVTVEETRAPTPVRATPDPDEGESAHDDEGGDAGGNDPATAEITPIGDDDDGDDVIPVAPRS